MNSEQAREMGEEEQPNDLEGDESELFDEEEVIDIADPYMPPARRR
jgi:hypothetical protein